jgi:hypothetical protein
VAIPLSELATTANRFSINAAAAGQRLFTNSEEVFGFWVIVDLVGSAAAREISEEQEYVRSAAFVIAIRELLGSYKPGDICLFKELGDGVFVYARTLRHAFEMLLLADAVAEASGRFGAPKLDFRAAVTAGSARTFGADYLGRPLDLCSRLVGYEPSTADSLGVVDLATLAHLDQATQIACLKFDDARLLRDKRPDVRLAFSEIHLDRARRDASSDELSML